MQRDSDAAFVAAGACTRSFTGLLGMNTVNLVMFTSLDEHFFYR